MKKTVIDFFVMISLLGFISMIAPTHASMPSEEDSSPFVRLSEIIPEIIESPRYAGQENFLGRPVPGYVSHHFYCTRQAAVALEKVNTALRQKGYTLVVYDAYRPQRAVDAFIEWTTLENDEAGKAFYYPSVPKKDLFSLGYLAKQSSHSRGSTFDVTLISLKDSLMPIRINQRALSNGDVIPFLDDNTLDMGSSFDLFHPASHHDSLLITAEQTRLRNLLRQEMHRYGFEEIKEEWWHYTLKNEPFPDTYFDLVMQDKSFGVYTHGEHDGNRQ